MSLAERIREASVAAGSIEIFYLAQAGFAIKTSSGRVIVIDPYLSDCVERLFGFRRMIPAQITPEELLPDLLLITHSHADHLDVDTLPVFAAQHCSFIAAPDCAQALEDSRIPGDRWTILSEGEQANYENVTVRAVYADHGELVPDAVGFVITVDGITIYNVGDSAFASDKILKSLGVPVDIMIAPINGAFGNLDADQAAELAALVNPKVVIASHFWMFIEHGGDPARFLEAGRQLEAGIKAVVMAPGESLVFNKETI